MQSSHSVYADDFSPDGRYFIYEESRPDKGTDLRLLPTAGEKKSVLYLKSPTEVWNAQFSPDGKWLAYVSEESSQPEVYVQSFPASEVRTQVSNGGGSFPRWRRDGKELFYRAMDGRLMVASVLVASGGLEFGTPLALFDGMAEPAGPHSYPYDISPDGQRILALGHAGAEGTQPLTVLINWQAGVKP